MQARQMPSECGVELELWKMDYYKKLLNLLKTTQDDDLFRILNKQNRLYISPEVSYPLFWGAICVLRQSPGIHARITELAAQFYNQVAPKYEDLIEVFSGISHLLPKEHEIFKELSEYFTEKKNSQDPDDLDFAIKLIRYLDLFFDAFDVENPPLIENSTKEEETENERESS
jgi:hypothetical protein